MSTPSANKMCPSSWTCVSLNAAFALELINLALALHSKVPHPSPCAMCTILHRYIELVVANHLKMWVLCVFVCTCVLLQSTVVLCI